MLTKNLNDIFPNIPNDLEKLGYSLENLDLDLLPKHVSIIMDGNGRWATQRGKKRLFGHTAGIESLRDIVRTTSDLGIKYLSIYAFSTENWARPKEEVMGLMNLFTRSVIKEMSALNKNNVKIKIIGDTSILPQKTQNAFNEACKLMKNNTGMTLIPAVNYGSRAEITKAVNEAINEKLNSKVNDETKFSISEKDIQNHLYTADIPDPDLLIRTSGEMRLSNYQLWQIAYSEIYITDVFWPDFDRYQYLKALIDYQKRDRRYGGIKK